MRRFDDITHSMDVSFSKLWEMVKDREARMLQSTGLQRVGHDLETEQKQPSLAKCQLALCSPFWIQAWLAGCRHVPLLGITGTLPL